MILFGFLFDEKQQIYFDALIAIFFMAGLAPTDEWCAAYVREFQASHVSKKELEAAHVPFSYETRLILILIFYHVQAMCCH